MTKQIEIPTNCPSCDSELELVNSQLFCRNSDCPAQSSKRVEAFVKKMRIKGLGPARISQLDFVHPVEIYETSVEDYVEILGEKIGRTIFNEVENSKNTTFAVFLAALSIPLIGETASKKVAAQGFNKIKDIINSDYVENIGPKAEENLYGYISENLDDLLYLESFLTFKIVEAPPKADNLGKVCITGKLKDFSNRSKAKEYLENLGYTVTTTVSSVTDYLVCEDGSNSSKTKKAESLGIPIVSIANLIEGN